MNTPLLYYDCISEFKRQFYNEILSFEHLIPGEIKISKTSFPDGGEEDNFNFWGYQFEKNGIKYLLSSKSTTGSEIKLNELLPIIPNDLQKVAYKGMAFHLINKPVSVRFRPEKKMSFKELVDKLNSLECSNIPQRRLMLLLGLTSLMDRANFRIATRPNFGKDSVVDTLGNLFGGAFTIENPTIAKLEYMTYAKWLAINEIVDIQKAEWRNDEQFLLASGAFKPEITKHSRATASGVKEMLDISKLSLSLLYNTLEDYPREEEYVDFIAKKAVLDRFPALRLHGQLTEDFNKIKGLDVKGFVKEHFQDYKDLIYTFTYYKENLNSELKRFNADKLNKDLPGRWLINLGRLLKIVDLYCDTQEEFDEHIGIINTALQDYKSMIENSNTYKMLVAGIKRQAKVKDKSVKEFWKD